MGISRCGRKADTRNEILLCGPYFCLRDQTDRIFFPSSSFFPSCMKSLLIIISLLSKHNQEQQINGWKWKFVYSVLYINKQHTLDRSTQPSGVTTGNKRVKTQSAGNSQPHDCLMLITLIRTPVAGPVMNPIIILVYVFLKLSFSPLFFTLAFS